MKFPRSARECHRKHSRFAKATTTKRNPNSVSAHSRAPEIVDSAEPAAEIVGAGTSTKAAPTGLMTVSTFAAVSGVLGAALRSLP